MEVSGVIISLQFFFTVFRCNLVIRMMMRNTEREVTTKQSSRMPRAMYSCIQNTLSIDKFLKKSYYVFTLVTCYCIVHIMKYIVMVINFNINNHFITNNNIIGWHFSEKLLRGGGQNRDSHLRGGHACVSVYAYKCLHCDSAK